MFHSTFANGRIRLHPRCGSVQGEIVMGMASVFAALWAAGAFDQEPAEQAAAGSNPKPVVILCKAMLTSGQRGSDKDFSVSWKSDIPEYSPNPKPSTEAIAKALSNWAVMVDQKENQTDISIAVKFGQQGQSSEITVFEEARADYEGANKIRWLEGGHGTNVRKICQKYYDCYVTYHALKSGNMTIEQARGFAARLWDILLEDDAIVSLNGDQDPMPSNKFRHAQLYARLRILAMLEEIQARFPGIPQDAIDQTLTGPQLRSRYDQLRAEVKLREAAVNERGNRFAEARDALIESIQNKKNKLYSMDRNWPIEELVGLPNGVLLPRNKQNLEKLILPSPNLDRAQSKNIAMMAGIVQLIESGSRLPTGAEFVKRIQACVNQARKDREPLMALLLAELDYYAAQKAYRFDIEINMYARHESINPLQITVKAGELSANRLIPVGRFHFRNNDSPVFEIAKESEAQVSIRTLSSEK